MVDGRFRLDFEVPLDAAEPAWVELAVRDAGGSGFSAIPGRTKATQAPAAIGACWSSVGDSGSNPATNFLGTTDAQPLVLRTGNVQSLRIEPSAESFGGTPITANVIAGSSANTVTAGVRGATISGGGVPTGLSDPNFTNEAPNRVTDAYGTVGGGYGNVRGRRGGLDGRSPLRHGRWRYPQHRTWALSTIGGGSSNRAEWGRQRRRWRLLQPSVGGSKCRRWRHRQLCQRLWQQRSVAETIRGQRRLMPSSGVAQQLAGGGYSCASGDRAKVRPAAAATRQMAVLAVPV